ncbi:conserved hypothetical protein [Rhodobacteraceae bacterium KLH11]|nr:conserved hypothetical protein [Rhodobacteraceae bacterium KLH11]
MLEPPVHQKQKFNAQVANFLGHGNVRTDNPDESWSLNVLELKLGRYKVRLTQDREVVANKVKPKGLIYTTDLEILGVKKYTEGETATNDICRLLSLASFSQVTPLECSFDGYGRHLLNLTDQAMYFRPLINIKSGDETQAFLEKTWASFRKKKRSRKLSEVIEMLTIAELPIQPLEIKLAQIFIIMENLKGTYAKANGIPFSKGFFRKVTDPAMPLNKQPRLNFETLLNSMFEEVGMRPSLKRIIRLRNEIIHFGLSRKPYTSLRKDYDFCHDIVREYLLRLLNYDGKYRLYSHASRTVKELN